MIGIIGGSGLYQIEGVEVIKEVFVRTPFGDPSAPVKLCKIGNKEVVFLARHGIGHVYPPHLVPYRANLWALKELGVDRVLAVSAVGGINPRYKPGDFVVVDDFIEFTKGRVSTYYEGKASVAVYGQDKPSKLLREGKVVHIDLSQAYCPQMRAVIIDVLESLGYPYHPSGTYACTEGPRFETPAEIKYIERLGGDVVGMTGYPEVVLARELAMSYAFLCVVANPAAGISKNRLTSDEVINLMKQKEEDIKRVLIEFVVSIPDRKTCNCDKVLDGAEV